jgi:predicted pyridoxine 5'-phosphate oxidase superfamily flavin-nucleotide-binding protein
MMTDVFHEGERLVQERAGVRDQAEKVGRIVQPALSPPFAAFLTDRDLIVLTTIDASGRPWVSVAAGKPGFVTATDETTVRIDTAALADGDIVTRLAARPAVGLLAIDLATRRRVRVNGHGRVSRDGAIEIEVAQCYGNCPKYIQQGEPARLDSSDRERHVTRGDSLNPSQRERIEGADTFFIGTHHSEGGADASHRGGSPGFIKLIDDRRLAFPDYSGNTMFQTLGNLVVDPRAGLLVIDFENGSILQLTGRASLDWDAARAAQIPGAERVVEFEVDEVVESANALRQSWSFREYSPFNPA